MIENIKRNGYYLTNYKINNIDYFAKDIIHIKQQEIDKYSYERCKKYGYLDIIKNLFKFTDPYLNLIKTDWINHIVDNLLGEKAVIYDVFGLLNIDQDNKTHIRNKFHRDQVYLNGILASIFVFIPLVDFTDDNGPTEIIPGSHLLKDKPSDDYINTNKIKIMAKAGQPFILDASVWHRGGDNLTKDPRPAILIRYQLPFLKRPIDLCQAYKNNLPHSELIDRRFGFDSQEMDSPEGYLCDKPIYGKGLYCLK